MRDIGAAQAGADVCVRVSLGGKSVNPTHKQQVDLWPDSLVAEKKLKLSLVWYGGTAFT